MSCDKTGIDFQWHVGSTGERKEIALLRRRSMASVAPSSAEAFEKLKEDKTKRTQASGIRTSGSVCGLGTCISESSVGIWVISPV